MCLSTVYLDKKDPKNVFLEEAASITLDNGAVLVRTMFGEKKSLKGYVLAEVNLLEHYVVLSKTGG